MKWALQCCAVASTDTSVLEPEEPEPEIETAAKTIRKVSSERRSTRVHRGDELERHSSMGRRCGSLLVAGHRGGSPHTSAADVVDDWNKLFWKASQLLRRSSLGRRHS
jgi:hypothetical protein